MIAAIVLFWPLAIPAYLASQRSARALGAGDVVTAAREGRAARGFGVAAVVAAAVSLVLTVAVWSVLLVNVLGGGSWTADAWGLDALEEELGLDPEPGAGGVETDWLDVQVGDCFDGSSLTEESYGVPVVPCEEEHVSEVFAVTELPDGEWPGTAVVDERSYDYCVEEFTAFVGEPYDESSLYVWPATPTEESWAWGDRTVLCVVEPMQGTVTGTLEGFTTRD